MSAWNVASKTRKELPVLVGCHLCQYCMKSIYVYVGLHLVCGPTFIMWAYIYMCEPTFINVNSTFINATLHL